MQEYINSVDPLKESAAGPSFGTYEVQSSSCSFLPPAWDRVVIGKSLGASKETMDELRKLSALMAHGPLENTFKRPSPRPPSKNTLPPPPRLPKLISVRDGSYSSYEINEEHLDRIGAQDTGLNGCFSDPTLEMVVVSRTGDDTIGLERRSRFENLLGNMKIDEVMRQHVYMCSYGFYHYEDCHGPSAASFDSGTRSFFFGNFLFSVVWSFDLGTGKTSAVLILRIIERHYNGVLPLKVLESSLQAYKDRLNSPLSLAFVLHTTLTHVLEDNLWRILTALRSIERDTKHGPSSCDFTGYRDESIPYGRQASQQKEKKEHVGRQDTGMQQLDDNESHIEDLTKVAQRLADVNVHLANVDRHAKLLKFMTNTLKDESFRKSYCKSDGNGGHTDCAEDTEYFVATLPSLGRRLDAIQPTIEYLQGRAKGQHQVVCQPSGDPPFSFVAGSLL